MGNFAHLFSLIRGTTCQFHSTRSKVKVTKTQQGDVVKDNLVMSDVQDMKLNIFLTHLSLTRFSHDKVLD